MHCACECTGTVLTISTYPSLHDSARHCQQMRDGVSGTVQFRLETPPHVLDELPACSLEGELQGANPGSV